MFLLDTNIQKLCANFCHTVNRGITYGYLRSRSAHFHGSDNNEYFNSNHRVHAVHSFMSVEMHTSPFILLLILPMRQPHTTTNSLLTVILLIYICSHIVADATCTRSVLPQKAHN